MLRWSETLKIGLCADRIVWVRLGGLRQRPTEKGVLAVPAAQGGPGWLGAVDILKQTLVAARARRAKGSVILSSRFVRYAVVPWHAALMSREERLAQARHCFRQIYGDVAASWSIALSPGDYGEPVLATAVERELLDALRQAFREARIQLVSVEPYLTTAYHRFRRGIKPQGDTACFSVVEPGDLSALVFKGAKLQTAFHYRIQEDWTRDLQGMRLQLAGDEGRAGASSFHVFAPEKALTDTSAMSGVMRMSLPATPGYVPSRDAALSMAMVA
jgi:hypothetical protein